VGYKNASLNSKNEGVGKLNCNVLDVNAGKSKKIVLVKHILH
jgi:hypothetical protein